jgi:uncharacterized membrane protein
MSFGIVNLVEGIIDHQVFGIHHVLKHAVRALDLLGYWIGLGPAMLIGGMADRRVRRPG